MQLSFDQITLFSQQNCIFHLTPLDYPSLFQQKLITSYFQLRQLLTQPRSDVLKVLHTCNERQLQITAFGIIYLMFLQQPSSDFLGYTSTLRAQTWILVGKHLTSLLKCTFTTIKSKYQPNIKHILMRLLYFGHFTQQLLFSLIKSINSFDSQQQIYNQTIVSFLTEVYTQQKNKPNSIILPILCTILFYKLLKITAHCYAQPLFKSLCVNLAQQLYTWNKEQCLSNIIVVEYLKQLSERDQEIRRTFISLGDMKQECIGRGQLCSYVVPALEQVEWAMQGERVEASVQMKWWWSKRGSQLAAVDLLCYLLHQKPLPGLVIEWVLRMLASSSPARFTLAKHQYFREWFAMEGDPIQVDQGMHLMKYLFGSSPVLAQDMLLYVLEHGKKEKARIKFILEEGLAVNYFMDGLKPATRYAYSCFVGKHQESSSLVLSDQSEEIEGAERIMSNHYLDQPHDTHVVFQLRFHQDMEETFIKVLHQPIRSNYQAFIGELISKLIYFKKNQEPKIMDTFIKQSAKLTYLAFYTEFEDHSLIAEKEQSIIYYLLNSVNSPWSQNNFQHQVLKKMVKKIITDYQTCEIAIWKYFLLYFKRGSCSNVKEMRDWLFTKEKTPYVIPIFNQLLDQSLKRTIFANAALLKIT